MLTNKLKSMAMGVSVAAMLSSSAHAGANITVAVSPSLSSAISDVISAFENYYSAAGYDVSLVTDTDANIEASIIAGGTSGPYDLFLSESIVAPADLQYNHPSTVTGAPFLFVQDTIDLYSSASNPVNISAGLPTTGIQPFSYADPLNRADPYGASALSVLAGNPAGQQALSDGLGVVAPTAVAAYAEVEYLGLAYGFVPKSQICAAFNGVEQYEPGSFHYQYDFPISLYGIQTALSSHTANSTVQTVLTDFVNFLTGNGTTAGQQALQNHCYKIPS
jgi:molybdate transport system substrate-binding protein